MQGWPHHIITKQSIIVVVGSGGGRETLGDAVSFGILKVNIIFNTMLQQNWSIYPLHTQDKDEVYVVPRTAEKISNSTFLITEYKQPMHEQNSLHNIPSVMVSCHVQWRSEGGSRRGICPRAPPGGGRQNPVKEFLKIYIR